MGLAAMMCALGVLTLIGVHKSGIQKFDSGSGGDDDAVEGGGGSSSSSSNNRNQWNLSEPFLAFYMILFAVLLFLYELMWWSPLVTLNDNMRKNFGFLYGLRGKGLYLIFVAFLCFGLGRDARVQILNWCTGITWLVVGVLHFFVICSKPEIAGQYQPPKTSYEMGASAVQDENVV